MPFVINFTWLIYVSFLTFDTLSIGLLGVMIPPPESGTCFTTRLFVRIVRSKLQLFIRMVADGHQPNNRISFTHYKDSLFKGGMSLSHYKEFRPRHI